MDSAFVAFVLIAVDTALGFGLVGLLAIVGLVVAIRSRATSRVCPQCGARVRKGLDHCMSCGFDLGTTGR
jgi:hypothetical protein